MRRVLTSKTPPWPRPPGVAALCRFAAALRGARAAPGAGGRCAGPASPVARVLRRVGVSLHLHGGTRHWQLVTALARAAVPASGAPPAPRSAAPTLVQRLLQRERRHTIERHLATHTLWVERRAEASPAWRVAPVAVPARVEQAARYPRLAVTLVRQGLPATSAAVTSLPREAGARSAAREAAWPPAARAAIEAPGGLAPQELSRVTEHVIRQLDRRVLSWQERTGRNLP